MKKVIDRNLDVPGLVNRPGIKFYDATEPPFRLHGCFVDGEGYYRVPTEVAERTSPNILEMHRYTTGARLRFVTDSPYVAVHIVLREPYTITRMADTGTLGLDVYSDGSFKGILVPPDVMKDDTYESVVNIGEREMHTVTVNLPLYTNVSELYIGLDETSALLEAPDYTYKKPIVYYGSSITNGATASRPGLTYEAIISRRFDIDHLNLGFGGSARGELSMAEYIASLDMSIFVYDYDHNAPTVKHLAETHGRMFDIVRRSHPELPIVMISRPRAAKTPDTDARFEVIKATYDKAVARGDRNVYLINGLDFFSGVGDDWSVDLIHPTDYGFRMMADKIGDVIEKILSGK